MSRCTVVLDGRSETIDNKQSIKKRRRERKQPDPETDPKACVLV